MTKRILTGVVDAMMAVLLTSPLAWAQGTAQISGIVRDASGGILPGVDVTATQTETGLTRSTVTNETGAYVLPNLPIGPYRLEVMLQGFRKFEQTGIVLQVNTNPVVDVELALGEVAETITVQANTTLVETRSTGIGQVMENQRILQLPLNGRNPADLLQYVAATVPQGNASPRAMQGGQAYAVAGGVAFGVAYLLDGATHNNPYDNLNLPLPFPDALAEFRIETSALTAQNGMHSGAAVNAVTRSGTNRFSGDAFEFWRNHKFNSTSPFAARNPDGTRQGDGLNRHQYGGTLGGPIVTDRLFFFGAYQGTQTDQTPADLRSFVPTAQMLAGDFTTFASPACNNGRQINLRAPFINNRIDSARFSPAALNITSRLPTTNDPCGLVQYSRPSSSDENQVVSKVDFNWSTNHSLFGRYIATTYFSPPPFTLSDNVLVTTVGGRDNLAQSFTFGDNYIFSPTSINSFRVAFNRTAIHRTHKDFFSGPDAGINIFSYMPDYMWLTVTGGFGLGNGTQNEARFTTNTYQISDDLTLVRGDHQFVFGANVAHWNSFSSANVRSMGFMSINGSATGLGLADFLTGRLTLLQQSAPNFLIMKQTYAGIYGQDTWRVTPRLTLNYGLRWEPFFPQQITNNAVYNFDLDRYRQGVSSTVFRKAPAGLYFPGDPGFPTKAGLHRQWDNLGPRIGIAWDPAGDGRTSVRASYSKAFEFVNAQFHLNTSNAPPWGNEIRLNNPPGGLDNPFLGADTPNIFPTTFNQDAPFTPFGPFLSIPYDLKSTRVHLWNVSVERQLASNLLVSVGYVGSRTLNLWVSSPLNNGLTTVTSVVLPSGQRVNCAPGASNFQACMNQILNQRRPLFLEDPENGRFLGPVDAYDDSGRQRYHGLIVSVRRGAVRGVMVNANYTLSNCYGSPTGSGGGTTNLGTGYNDPNNPHLDDGYCVSDRRHIFTLTAGAGTPEFANRGLRAVASGWRLVGSLRASSGSWLTVTPGSDRALNGQAGTQRVNQVLDNPRGDDSINPVNGGRRYLNPAAFELPALGTLGNLQRNSIRGPSTPVVDLALTRVFRFGSGAGQRIEFRAEAFNAFNALRWGNPNTNRSSAIFGQITSAGDPRIMQFALKYGF